MEIETQIIKQPQHFKYLIVLSMLYSATLLLSGLYTYRPVIIAGHAFVASSLIYPLSYTLNDIICEVYGYQNSRRLVWFGIAVVFFFAFVTQTLDALPYPHSWNHQAAYLNVLGSYLRLSWAGLISMMVGEFINIIAMSKWRALLGGRLFWLRSLGSTSIGSAVDSIAEYLVAFIGIVTFGKMFELLLFAYLFRVIYAAIMIIPSTFIVAILKRAENRDEFSPVITYNPFSLQD